MQETDLTEFYTALVIDRNLNGRMDRSELNKMTSKLNKNSIFFETKNNS